MDDSFNRENLMEILSCPLIDYGIPAKFEAIFPIKGEDLKLFISQDGIKFVRRHDFYHYDVPIKPEDAFKMMSEENRKTMMFYFSCLK